MALREKGSEPAGRPHALTFWVFAILATLLLYFLALRYLQPGYFSPLSPYHIDFYEYAAMRIKTATMVLFGYPRPIAYYAMHVFGAGGIGGVMVGSIVLALGNVLLTVAYVRRIFGLYSPWLLASVSLYLALNLTHPDFYFEHRHDLPAQVSYLGLIVSLLAWDAWLQRLDKPGKSRLSVPLGPAVILLSGICFAFSKETYFVSALCLVAALAVTDRRRRRLHLGFLAFLAVLEVASLLWTRHVQSPFVDVEAAAESTYRISVDPISLIRTFGFYVYHLLNPWVLALVVLALAIAWLPRDRFIRALAFPVAGLAAFAPHALLPNHRFEEYAWAAAPLFFAPILLLGVRSSAALSKKLQVSAALMLSILAIAGPLGYRRAYRSSELTFLLGQEKTGGAIARSLDRLRQIPSSARVLVTGLENPAVPWQVTDFIRSEFGENVYWTVVFPPNVSVRRASRFIAFPSPADVDLKQFDYIATYRGTGELIAIRKTADAIASEQPATILAPALAEPLSRSLTSPADYRPLLEAAAMATEWGLASEAIELLDRAKALGAPAEPEVLDLAARTEELRKTQAAPKVRSTLTARPDTIRNPDANGLGVTEIIWRIPDGLAIEVHVDAPDGPLLAQSDSSGSAHTDRWVSDGMQFFLQNVTGGKPLTPENTLASVKVRVTR